MLKLILRLLKLKRWELRGLVIRETYEMTEEPPPWVLVEGPGPGDAEFLGRWLLAAVAADKRSRNNENMCL